MQQRPHTVKLEIILLGYGGVDVLFPATAFIEESIGRLGRVSK
jgi:hypothetical protein